MRNLAAGLAALLWSLTQMATAAGPAQEFSAQAVQKVPDQQPRIARMYVGKGKVRMEYGEQAHGAVEIIDTEKGQAYLLRPDQKTYMQQPTPQAALVEVPDRDEDFDPCAGMEDVQCRQLGTEEMFGRKAQKWEMVGEVDGRTLRSLHWIDAERQIPLKQIWPDGTIVESRPVGEERLDGRRTEKWRMVTTSPEGETMESTQWYDPQLRIVVREEMPGGFLRELRDIQVGPQDPDLFRVPSGYRRVEMPQGGSGSRGAPSGPGGQGQRPSPQYRPDAGRGGPQGGYQGQQPGGYGQGAYPGQGGRSGYPGYPQR